MSLTLTPSAIILNAYATQPFSADGGTSPYTYSVLSGRGAIDSVTGNFTASANSGLTVVRATDSVGLTIDAPVTVKTVFTRVCEIIRSQMGLDEDQVYLWNQKLKIPPDERLYIAVGVQSSRTFSNNRSMQLIGPDYVEVLSSNFLVTLSLDILSRGPEARDRIGEVMMALKSTFAQQEQEANSFLIGTIGRFNDTSSIDGTSIPYRFSGSVNLQYQVSKTQVASDYETFDQSVITEE